MIARGQKLKVIAKTVLSFPSQHKKASQYIPKVQARFRIGKATGIRETIHSPL